MEKEGCQRVQLLKSKWPHSIPQRRSISSQESSTSSMENMVPAPGRNLESLEQSPLTDTSSQHKHSVRPPPYKCYQGKPRLKVPSRLDVIFQRRRIPRSAFYLTEGGFGPLAEPRDVEKEECPFLVRPDSEPKDHCKSVSRATRPDTTHSSRQTFDIRSRVHVPYDATIEKELSKIKGITDLDRDYFKLVQNRPFKTKFRIQHYVEDVRSTLRTRVETCIAQDEISKIEEQCYIEWKYFENISEKQEKYRRAFETFLAEDFEAARSQLQIQDELTEKSRKLISEKASLIEKLEQLRSQLYGLEEKWTKLKIYQKFVYRLAALPWRLEHDWINRDSAGNLVQHAETADAYTRSRDDKSLEELLAEYSNQVAGAPLPKLPYESHEEFLDILNGVTESTMHSMAHLEQVAVPLEMAEFGLKHARAKMDKELVKMRSNVDRLQIKIEREEQRGYSLKKRGEHMMLKGLRACFNMGPDLAVHVWIEDAYETIFTRNITKLSALTMSKEIEKEFEKLCLELDTLPLDCVQEAQAEVREEEDVIAEKALDADRKLKMANALLKTVRRGLERPPPFGPRRSPQKTELKTPVPKPPAATRKINELERELLNFFTDWCKFDDIETFLKQVEGFERPKN